eukprot:3261370-Prymnesium_polylepis.1
MRSGRQGSFMQAMATDELRRMTASVTTTDTFLYSVAPPEVWSPFGMHFSSSVVTRGLQWFFYRWVRPLNFGLIPFVAPMYVLVCKLEWPGSELFEGAANITSSQ